MSWTKTLGTVFRKAPFAQYFTVPHRFHPESSNSAGMAPESPESAGMVPEWLDSSGIAPEWHWNSSHRSPKLT